MAYLFPVENSEEIDVTFGGYGRIVILAKDGDIRVCQIWEGYDDVSVLNENDHLYWLGCVYWWYRMDGGDYWSCDDWWRAAQCCLILKKVPTFEYLKKVCGINATGEPYDYYQMKRAMDLADFANKCNTDFREGAD